MGLFEKTQAPRKRDRPSGTPHFRLWGARNEPMGMIWSHYALGTRPMEKNIEVDFLVVDVPTAYNIILGRPTLHDVKAVTASYLFQLRFEANDVSVGKLQGDQ